MEITPSKFRAMRKHAGLCTNCGAEDAYTMIGRSLCSKCAEYFAGKADEYRKHPDNREKVRLYKKQMREERKSAGLCPNCGKAKPSPGFVRCDDCRAYGRRVTMRYNDKKYGPRPRGEYGICWTCNKREVIPGKRLCFECSEKAEKNLIPMRLTERTLDGYITIKGCASVYPSEERKRAPATSAIVRLCAYEDSGLTPDEVAELKTLWGMYGGEDGITAAFKAKQELDQIVRCKGCYYSVGHSPLSADLIYCIKLRCYMKENDFCSYGKRKENDKC